MLFFSSKHGFPKGQRLHVNGDWSGGESTRSLGGGEVFPSYNEKFYIIDDSLCQKERECVSCSVKKDLEFIVVKVDRRKRENEYNVEFWCCAGCRETIFEGEK